MKKSVRPKARPAQTAGELNAAQQQAVRHGRTPLLIIAGAGTGKTLTLAHRVARLIEDGVPPERILLLTFTRRAAAELLHRVDTLRRSRPAQKGAAAGAASPRKVWGGTFHAVGARLLRIHGPAIGVDPRFTIHDQADSTDLLDALRAELKLAEKNKQFPKKGSCHAVHSGWINSGKKLEAFLKASYPWCLRDEDGLRRLFQAYAERKRQQNVFDFDEERRLFYVALTRARTWLTVTYPRFLSSFQSHWGSWDDVPTLTRFLPAAVRRLFQSI